MFYHLSVHIADKLAQLKVISLDDYELYRYGIQQGLVLVMNFVSVILISIILGMFIECIAFLLAYVPLRSYAGGFHAKTHVRCYAYSMMIIIGIFLAMRFLSIPLRVYVSLTIFGIASVIFLAPVEDKNKVLDKKEHTVYRKRAIEILLIIVLFQIVLLYIHAMNLFGAVALSQFVLGVLLIIGQIKNCILKTHR